MEVFTPKLLNKPGILCLDFVSEGVSNKIRNFIRKSNLNIRIVFLPCRKLHNVFCSSRPYDHKKCMNTKCDICPRITTKGKNCLVKNIVYTIACNICRQTFIGESSRTAYQRLGEHLRYAKHPLAKSNCEKALAVHYIKEHNGCDPDLSFDILTIQTNTHRRKIYEAMFICFFFVSLTFDFYLFQRNVISYTKTLITQLKKEV